MGASGHKRTVAEGRFVVPSDWPRWKKRCGITKRGNTCKLWAVTGMPTCRFHGSGGEVNRQLGALRYLAWVITGGPQNVPVSHACRIAMAVFAEAVLKQGKGSELNQMKAAMWMTKLLDDQAPQYEYVDDEIRSAPSPTDVVG